MKLPFYDAMPTGLDARAKLYTAYLYISIIVLIAFSALFMALGYHMAAFIELAMVLSFVTAFILAVKKHIYASKIISTSTSIAVVLIQANYVFTPETGFQFLLFPLLVITFLFNDTSVRTERLLTIFYSAVITIAFFVSSNTQFSGPLVSFKEAHQPIFYNLSLLTSFIALSLLLYLYSLQLAHKEATLSYLAEYDALTQIYNRGYFTATGYEKFQAFKENKQNTFSDHYRHRRL